MVSIILGLVSAFFFFCIVIASAQVVSEHGQKVFGCILLVVAFLSSVYLGYLIGKDEAKNVETELVSEIKGGE